MSAEGGAIDGVPVPLYIDPEKEKERALVKEREKAKGGQKRDKEALNRAASSSAWPSIFNLENLFGRRKVRYCNNVHRQYWHLIYVTIAECFTSQLFYVTSPIVEAHGDTQS